MNYCSQQERLYAWRRYHSVPIKHTVSMYLWNTDMYGRMHTQAYQCSNKDMDLLLGKYEYCAVINTLNNSDYLFYSTHKHKGQLLGNIP